MKTKTANVLAHLAKHGVVKIKMDRASGLTQLVITRKPDGSYVVGKTPGAGLTRYNEGEVINALEHLSMFIVSWGN